MGWPIGCRVIASLLPPSGGLGGPWVSSQDTVGCTPHICKGNRVEVCYGAFQRAALQQEPAYRVQGVLIDGFDSTTKSLRTLFPGARLGTCLPHALLKLPKKLVAIASPVRKALRSQFHTLLYRARQRKGLRVFALGQRLRRF